MSSNLTISYTSQTTAGLAPGGAPAADAPAADNPLGFLAALIDQLLAGGGAAAPATQAASTETAVDIPVDGLLHLTLGNETTMPPVDPPEGGDDGLVANLTNQLDALQAQLSAGQIPSADQLDVLARTIGAISGTGAPRELGNRLLTLSQSVAATAPALSRQLESLSAQLSANIAPQPSPDLHADLTLAQIIRALLGNNSAPNDPSSIVETDDPAPAAGIAKPGDELLQLLASYGITTAPADAAPPAPVPATRESTSAGVPSALVRLSTQLSKLSTELAPVAPELAQKLDAVATKLVSVDSDPKLLAQLTVAVADPDRTTLDKLVQNLIDAKPAPLNPLPAAPQIAAAAELEIPAPIAPKQSKSAVTEVKAAPPPPAPVTADSAPPAPATTPAPASEPPLRISAEVAPKADADPEPKAEAKIVAETTKADPVKTDAAPSPQQATAPVVVVPAQVRHLPAAYQQAANPINMGQVAFEMVRQVHQGSSRFTIRLDPPEMGRVDVRMHIDAAGTVNARLVVERAETLDMFQRDQRSLERALAQAGLDSSKTNLEFSLRQNPFAGMTGGDQRQQQQNFGAGPRFSLTSSEESATPVVTLYRGTASAGGVNIFA